MEPKGANKLAVHCRKREKRVGQYIDVGFIDIRELGAAFGRNQIKK